MENQWKIRTKQNSDITGPEETDVMNVLFGIEIMTQSINFISFWEEDRTKS